MFSNTHKLGSNHMAVSSSPHWIHRLPGSLSHVYGPHSISQLPNYRVIHQHFRHRIWNFIFGWSVWVRSFTDSDLSDAENIVPFENTTSINLINLFCILLVWLVFLNGITFCCILHRVKASFQTRSNHNNSGKKNTFSLTLPDYLQTNWLFQVLDIGGDY